MKPEVSIILPSYNYERYIYKAIDSVLDQSFTNWELIIIDDGSKDSSIDVIKKYKDKRIHLYAQSNQGVSKTLNKGIKLSKGKYICFLDADDKYHPDKLSSQVDTMNAGFDIVTTKVEAIDENDEKSAIEHFNTSWNLYNIEEISGKNKIFNFLIKNYFCKSSLMIKKDLFDKYGYFNIKLITAYDLELWLKMVQSSRITRVEKVLTYYRWHGRNETTVNNNRIRTELILILDTFIRDIKISKRKQLVLKYLKSINTCIKNNGLYEGFVALQLIKTVYNLGDNYELFNIREAQDTLYNALNGLSETDSTESLIVLEPARIHENTFQKMRRKLIPLKIRILIKNRLIRN